MGLQGVGKILKWAAGGSILIGMVLLAGVPTARAADWPQFMGPTGDAVSTEKGLLRAFPAEGPKVLWTRDMGPGFGEAAIRDGKVYVLDRPGDQEALLCLDLATGKEEWRFDYDAPGKFAFPGSRSTPAVSAQRVYIIGATGLMHCIDRTTHQVVWKKDLLTEFGGRLPTWAIGQSPVLYKDMVFVAPQARQAGIVAYDQATGQERWRSEPVGQMAYSTVRVLTIDGVDQAILVNNDGATAVSAADGKKLWSYAHRCQISIPFVASLGGGKLFITGGYNAGSAVFQVARDGENWSATMVGNDAAIGGQCHPGIVYGDHVYVLCNTNSRADGMVCFDSQAKVVWQTQRDPYLCKGGSILTGDNLMYVMSGDTGDLYIVQPSPEGFKALAKAPVLGGKTIWGNLALSNGCLVLRDQKQMKCLDMRAK